MSSFDDMFSSLARLKIRTPKGLRPPSVLLMVLVFLFVRRVGLHGAHLEGRFGLALLGGGRLGHELSPRRGGLLAGRIGSFFRPLLACRGRRRGGGAAGT